MICISTIKKGKILCKPIATEGVAERYERLRVVDVTAEEVTLTSALNGVSSDEEVPVETYALYEVAAKWYTGESINNRRVIARKQNRQSTPLFQQQPLVHLRAYHACSNCGAETKLGYPDDTPICPRCFSQAISSKQPVQKTKELKESLLYLRTIVGDTTGLISQEFKRHLTALINAIDG